MKSYYYHSTLTIGWRIFNYIENSSSPTHDFDECKCIYHHIMIDTSLSIAAKKLLLWHCYPI
jgi:hypothetical protein